jgi:hypothetical protein
MLTGADLLAKVKELGDASNVPRQPPWPSVRPQVVAGDNLGAATRKVSHPAARRWITTGFS